MKKRIPAIILMFTLFLTGAFAANVYQKSINVTYGIQVFFNGQKLTMTNVNGNPVEPFVYQGTTYVPIRAISETFGADVSYDGASRTAYIYDDFTEIITAAYKLNRTIDVCTMQLDVYDSAIDANSFEENPYSAQKDIDKFLTRDSKMLNTLSSENVNYSLLEETLLPLYNDFVSSYKIAVSDYCSMYDKKSYSNYDLWANYFSSSGKASINGISYSLELEDFLDSYNWRTFDVQ